MLLGIPKLLGVGPGLFAPRPNAFESAAEVLVDLASLFRLTPEQFRILASAFGGFPVALGGFWIGRVRHGLPG